MGDLESEEGPMIVSACLSLGRGDLGSGRFSRVPGQPFAAPPGQKHILLRRRRRRRAASTSGKQISTTTRIFKRVTQIDVDELLRRRSRKRIIDGSSVFLGGPPSR